MAWASSRCRRGSSTSIKDEIAKIRDLTDKPWGVNVAQLLVRDPSIVDFIVEHGVRLRDDIGRRPAVFVPRLKAAGVTTFHVVPSLRGALKAIAAGVDGLVVEGIEGGGFKNPDGASTMVLVPLIAAHGRRAHHRGRWHLRRRRRWPPRSRSGPRACRWAPAC